jgi:hypothetical protein
MRGYLGFQRRSLSHAADTQQSGMFYLGIRTSIFNRYYDI